MYFLDTDIRVPASEWLTSASNLCIPGIILLQMMPPGRYNGPEIAAAAVEKYFGNSKEKTYILDVASGTGLVAEHVSERCLFTLMRVNDVHRKITSFMPNELSYVL